MLLSMLSENRAWKVDQLCVDIAGFLMLSFYVIIGWQLGIQALAITCNILQMTKSVTRPAISALHVLHVAIVRIKLNMIMISACFDDWLATIVIVILKKLSEQAQTDTKTLASLW